jgi:hypothetical protein
MDADPHTGAFPGSSVMIDALPLGEIARQQAPLSSPFRHIKDGIEHRSHTQGARSSTACGGGDHLFDPLPFLVSQVAWIYFFVHLPILRNLRRLIRQALAVHTGAGRVPGGGGAYSETFLDKVVRSAHLAS